MSLPVSSKIFVDSGSSERESENFQHYLFKDLNFKEREKPISFFRSDFRGVKIEAVKFYRNNFDRADFINAYIKDTEFEECYFGTDFSNTIFTNVQFTQNKEENCSFYNCHFLNCMFDRELVSGTTNRNSVYASCSFIECDYGKNTFDDISYESCDLKRLSFAEMGSYNLNFSSCHFEEVIVDPDYLGSYLIKESSLEGLKYSYRGTPLELSGNIIEDLKTLSLFYLNSNRFHEAFNTFLLYAHYSNQELSIFPFFGKLIGQIISDEHYLRRIEQIDRIIKILMFYSNSKVLPKNICFQLIGQIEIMNVSFEKIKDKIHFNNMLYLLKETVESELFELGGWNELNPLEVIYAEVEIDDSHLEQFQSELNLYVYAMAVEYALLEGADCKIVGTRKGSLILEILGASIFIYSLASIAKSIISKGMEVKMEYKIAQKTEDLLLGSNLEQMNDWSKKVDIARKILKKPSDELLQKGTPLVKLMKSFHIFPNTIFKS